MKTNNPTNQLNSFLEKKIRVYLRNKTKLEGKLCGFDQFMNLTIKDLEIISETNSEFLGISLVRGNLILSIQPLEK